MDQHPAIQFLVMAPPIDPSGRKWQWTIHAKSTIFFRDFQLPCLHTGGYAHFCWLITIFITTAHVFPIFSQFGACLAQDVPKGLRSMVERCWASAC
jgi:hypothetical protein